MHTFMTFGLYNNPMESLNERFESVYQETYGRLSRYVYFKAPTLQDAEDIVAAVYCHYYQYVVRQNRRPLVVYAYLQRMANHELNRFYSDRERLPKLSMDDDSLGLEQILSTDWDFSLERFDPIDAERLWQAVLQLSPAEQKVIVGKIRFDLSFHQLASYLNQGESAVKLRYYRALQKLQKNLSLLD